MNTVTANDLKVKGISVVENILKDNAEAVISVRGQDKYVVMDLDTYAKFREYELCIAVEEARNDMAAGRYTAESVAEHMERLRDEL